MSITRIVVHLTRQMYGFGESVNVYTVFLVGHLAYSTGRRFGLFFT